MGEITENQTCEILGGCQRSTVRDSNMIQAFIVAPAVDKIQIALQLLHSRKVHGPYILENRLCAVASGERPYADVGAT